jgi:hypothetical protein
MICSPQLSHRSAINFAFLSIRRTRIARIDTFDRPILKIAYFARLAPDPSGVGYLPAASVSACTHPAILQDNHRQHQIGKDESGAQVH